MKQALYIILCSVLFSACDSQLFIQKRKYRKGFYLSLLAHPKKNNTQHQLAKEAKTNNSESLQTNIIKSAAAVSEVFSPVNVSVRLDQKLVTKKLKGQIKLSETKSIRIIKNEKAKLVKARKFIKHKSDRKSPLGGLAILTLVLFCIFLIGMFTQGTVNGFLIKLFRLSSILLAILACIFLILTLIEAFPFTLGFVLFVFLEFLSIQLWQKQSELFAREF